MAIIKWAGGKTQLLSELKTGLPTNIGTYAEPFIGSGALFFALAPENAIINDFNTELANLYKQIKDNPGELKAHLQAYEGMYNSLESFDAKKELYYSKRAEFNQNIVDASLGIEDAALFIFLNKTCFNGLYRVNKAGTFNVPMGKYKNIKLYNEEDFARASKILASTKIMCGDFEEACKDLKKNDFVYFDPPYYDTFTAYQAGGFSEQDQVRLATLFKALTDNGVYCMLSNSDTEFIKELYKDFDIEVVKAKRMINRNGNDRTGTEIIVRNFSKKVVG